MARLTLTETCSTGRSSKVVQQWRRAVWRKTCQIPWVGEQSNARKGVVDDGSLIEGRAVMQDVSEVIAASRGRKGEEHAVQVPLARTMLCGEVDRPADADLDNWLQFRSARREGTVVTVIN